MELRKVNQVGKDTLTVSLPKPWVKRNEIKKGDQLKLETHNNKLVIKTAESRQEIEAIDTENLNTFLLNKLILNAYMKNVSKIMININADKIYNSELETEVSLANYVSSIISTYMGMEIISHNNKTIIIQNLFEGGEVSNLSLIQKRTISLFTEFLERVINSLDSPGDLHNFQIEKEALNIRKFIYHNMRLIVDSEESTFSKIKFYALYDHLDNSLHSTEKLITLLIQKKPSQKVVALIGEIFVLFIKFLHIKKNIETPSLNRLIAERHNLLKKISDSNLNVGESKIIREIRIFLNLHHDFILANLR